MSYFCVVVPTKQQEAVLKQKEKNIQILQFGNVDSTSLAASSTTTTASLGSLKEKDFDQKSVDVYNAKMDGESVQIVVSEDAMQIRNRKPTPTAQQAKDKAEQQEREARIADIFMEKHLEDCLTQFEITTASWEHSVDGQFSQVTFCVSAESSEKIIDVLTAVGIGKKYQSQLCVCATSVFYDASAEPSSLDPLDESSKSHKWKEFVASVKSRLTVAQVVQGVKANAVLTFDFIVLIIIAGMIAGLGLVDDSPVNVVASMLVSPLMGPIMAMVFGSAIHDWSLVRLGVVNELVGLFLCLTVGYIFGVSLQLDQGPWKGVEKWPTEQIIARSRPSALIVGVLVAIPSGAGVALSILAGNSGSLVGVAISASLLPPAVNCGILWGMATVIAVIEGTSFGLDCDHKLHHNYTRGVEKIFCDNTALEYVKMGANSLGLTLINIALIFLVGVIILKIKEVAPFTTRKSLDRFWKEDIKVAREHNKSNILTEIDGEDKGTKAAIVKSLEQDSTFNAVNFRTNSHVGTRLLRDLKANKAVGRRSWDVGPISGEMEEDQGQSSREQPPQPTTSTSGGWFFSNWFSSKAPEPTSNPSNHPVSVMNVNTKKNRPKLLPYLPK